ncbi:MAG: flagellar protein FlgN [Oscillospiraceae bacterium]|nr:flagellar protein FlgN [Oscillospiraceae bacterium]
MTETNAAAAQKALLEDLIALSYEKRLAITQNNIDALQSCSGREFSLAQKLKALANSERAVDPEVRSLAYTLKDRNELNQELIQTHLEYTDTMIRLMTPEADPLNNFYDARGRTGEKRLRVGSGGLFNAEF